MQKNLNELGNALLLVLMVIVIFSVLGLGLITLNVSATKQFAKKEEQVQARHQAEMGVLHYKAEIDKAVNGYIPELYDESGNLYTEEDIRQKVCSKIKGISKPEKEDNSFEYHTKAKTGECSTGPNNGLIYEFASIGKAGDTNKEIEAKIVVVPEPAALPALENPGEEDHSNDNSLPFEQPKIPSDTKPKSKLPPSNTKDKFIVINEKVTTHKDNRKYNGTLIINVEPDKDAFEIKGGKSDNLYVGGDFYVGGNVHVQNHACMVIGGNMTVDGSFNFQGNPESNIIIIGDAYFSKMPTYKEKINFHVVGKTYIGKPPIEYTSGLKNTDALKSSCYQNSGLPNTADPDPNPNPPTPPIPLPGSWTVEGSVNAEYK
ncbi:hypothetical protein AB1K83_07070 [Sporosarcina sp. 179-K 3D1 HS]|uniref:hypothetical protein n=1 Tax=Sporosarcina sp. 179-K 3D1 HS TaxID=3232169 RepID=UPI00399FC32B